MSKSLVEVEGYDTLLRKVRQLGNDKVKRREMLKILRQASKGTVRAGRAQAPVSSKQHVISGSRARRVINPGQLRKSIGNITGKAKDKAVIYVGPRTKGKRYDGFYGAFVHGGTKNITADPFMDRAYQQTKGQVTAETEKSVARYIQKQIDRLSNA